MDNSRAEGTNSYLCWYYIGLINEKLGDVKNAKTFYLKCGDFAPARKRLEGLSL